MHGMKLTLKWSVVLIAFILTGVDGAHGERAATTPSNERPRLWEAGVVLAAARLPHYIGSDEYENYIYPLPYLIYRGEFVQADRDGIRGIFYRGEKFETDLSLWGNPPVPDDNQAREGMPELDAVGEGGPALRYYFFRRNWRDHLYLQAAWRAAFSFDFGGGVDADYQGWNGGLHLRYQNRSRFEAQKLSLYLKAGIHFADSLYNNYFYGVPEPFATPARNAFRADGGYSGASLSGSLFKALSSRLSVGCYARWNNLNRAVFEDSPLVREKNTYALGFLMVWKLAASSKSAR